MNLTNLQAMLFVSQKVSRENRLVFDVADRPPEMPNLDADKSPVQHEMTQEQADQLAPESAELRNFAKKVLADNSVESWGPWANGVKVEQARNPADDLDNKGVPVEETIRSVEQGGRNFNVQPITPPVVHITPPATPAPTPTPTPIAPPPTPTPC